MINRIANTIKFIFIDILPSVWACSNQPYIHFHVVGYSRPKMDEIITRELHKAELRYSTIFDKQIKREYRKRLIKQMESK